MRRTRNYRMIFDEKEYAEKLLQSGSIKFMYYVDLVIIAKYLRYIGKNNKQVKEDLVNFCKKFNNDYNEIIYDQRINNAIKTSQKSTLKMHMDINITEEEMKTIRSAGGYNIQKILFVYLALGKHSKKNNTLIKKNEKEEYKDFYYVSNGTRNKFFVFGLAKVNLRGEDRVTLLYNLGQNGLLGHTRKGSVTILFVDEDSPSEIVISDMNNIISFFGYICPLCGCEVENPSAKKNICDECYRKQRKERPKNINK